jgi:DNA-binding FrmR family transcriptional regulator
MEPVKKGDIRNRLKCIEGHARGVGCMVEAEADCMDIIYQINAIQGSLRRVKRLLIEEYLVAYLPGALAGEGPEEPARFLGPLAELLNSPD